MSTVNLRRKVTGACITIYPRTAEESENPDEVSKFLWFMRMLLQLPGDKKLHHTRETA